MGTRAGLFAPFVGALVASLVFLCLSANDGVTLRLEVVLDLPQPSRGQVFWSGETDGFVAERGVAFDVHAGTGVYAVTLPTGVGKLRIDPSSAPGHVEVRTVELARFGVPLRVWSGWRGFEGWVPLHDISDMDVRGGALHMQATGADPGFVSVGRLELLRRVHLADASLSLLAGLGATLLLVLISPTARSRLRARCGRAAALFAGARRFLVQSVAILALGAGLSEVAMRLYHHFIPVFVFPGERTRRFRGQPSGLDYDFRLNSHGFKDVEYALKKAPETVRVLGLGDSFAFGVVPYEHTYLTLLEQDLLRVSPPAEVINMGISSTGPREYVEVLVNEGLPLHADMVLLSFFIGNDFIDVQPTPPPRSYLFAFLRYLAMPKPQGVPVNGAGVYDDDKPNFGPQQYLEIEHGRAGIFRKSDAVFTDAFAAVHAHLTRMKQICDARGLDLMVVLIPDEMQVDAGLQAEVVSSFPASAEDFDFALPNRKLREDLDHLGIRHLELLEAFREVGRHTRLYRPRDTHWNIAGNRLAADLIRDEMLSGRTKFWPRPAR